MIGSIKLLKLEEKIPVVLVDSEGIITMTNKAFEKAFGWKQRDLEGKSLSRIIPEELENAHNMGFSRYLVSEKSTILNQPLDLKIKTKDGSVLMAEHTIISEKQGNSYVFGATIRSVDKQER